MSMSDQNGSSPSDDMTQGENPGAQGDFGAGQGDPGLNDPVVGDDDVVEGAEQPRRNDDLDSPESDDDDLIAPLDRDPGDDATTINGGNSDR